MFNTLRRFHISIGEGEKGELESVVSLGKVRTELVKRISGELVEKYPRSFNEEFEQNKQFLRQIELDVSKKLRNRIAGYITGSMKIEQASNIYQAQSTTESLQFR